MPSAHPPPPHGNATPAGRHGPEPEAPQGAPLHARRRGHGRRLVLAHGFTQTARVWGGLDDDLAADHELVQVDLPGHGGSASVAADLWTGAARLADAGGAGTYLGYSMGARFCLHVALERQDLVDRLVLVSGTAGIDDASERAGRRRSDEALAERLDPVSGGPPTDTVREFVARWVANPMFGIVPPSANAVEERCTNSGPGLASSLRLAGTGTMEPLWERLSAVTVPVLVVTGARDRKFTALGRRLVAGLGGPADLVAIDGADHAPHLQHPGAVAAAIRGFLATEARR